MSLCGAGLFFNGPAHGSQVLAETQGRYLLALGKVAVELHLTAQGDTCVDLSGLAPLGVADRLREREDIPGAAGRHEQHAIVIPQDQVLTIYGPISHRGGRQRIQTRASRRCGPAGIVPRLKTGNPIAWMSAVSRCSPQITIPSRPAA